MEKPKNLVRILEISKISPPPDSPSSTIDFSLPFTFFDALFLKIPPTERLFFYSLSHSSSNQKNSILSHLKHSLSLTLLHFLPLAGTLSWPPHSPKPAILYTPGDSVSLTVADTDADFDFFSSNNIVHQVEECRPFVPELPATDKSVPVLALQVTLFQNRGLSIGVSNHHGFMDGKSSIMFLKSWAYIFKNIENGTEKPLNLNLPPELTPVFDRSIIKDPKGIDMLYINYWLNKTKPIVKTLKYFPNLGVSPDMVRGTFQFTRKDIEKLRKSASKSSKPIRFSSFVLAFAYISICVIKSARIEEQKKKIYLGFYADWRARLNPPIPTNYFGNCGGSHGVFAEAMEEEEDDDKIEIISKKIHETIKELDENVMEGAEESLSKWENVEIGGIKFIGVVGSPRLGVYELDFGWGKPENVKMVSIERTGSISLADDRDGDGIEVGLVLSRHEMQVFSSVFYDGLKAL